MSQSSALCWDADLLRFEGIFDDRKIESERLTNQQGHDLVELSYWHMDGFECRNRNSKTFEFLGYDAISQVRAGDLVKIGMEISSDLEKGHTGERYWVMIVSAFGPDTATCFTATIENNLHCSINHGLPRVREIAFEPNIVLAVAKDSS